MNKLLTLLLMMNLSCLLSSRAQAPMDGGVWKDNTGKHINAHGGNCCPEESAKAERP